MAYSRELREKAVEAYRDGLGTRTVISRIFGIGTATLGRWIRFNREQGSPQRRPHGGGQRRRIGEVGEVVLAALLERHPDATLDELAGLYGSVTTMPMNGRVVCRSLHRMGITRKKRRSSRKSERVFGSRSYEWSFVPN